MVAILVAIGFQLVLPDKVIGGLGPRWLLPALEGGSALAILIVNPNHTKKDAGQARLASLAIIALINVANIVSLAELVGRLVSGHAHAGGRSLIYASVPIWLTNVVVFALWYWELDRGGPAARLDPGHRNPDFLFPQMSTPEVAPGWTPTFLDYLYTSFTNATAFSPTDTMPLTPTAKMLMLVQSLASLLTVVVVVSRAINIL